MKVTYVYISSMQAVMFASVLAREIPVLAIVKGHYLEKALLEHKIPIAFSLNKKIALKNPVSWIKCYMERKALTKKIAKDSEIIFTFLSVDLEGLALIARMCKFCKVSFFPMDWVERRTASATPFSFAYLRVRLRTLGLKMLLNLPEIQIYRHSGYFLGIDDRFLEKRNIKKFKMLSSPDDVRKNYAEQNQKRGVRIILLGLPEFTLDQEVAFMEIMNRLSHYDGFLYVAHPRYDQKNKNLCRQHNGLAESYISPDTIVIGVASAVMIHAIRNYNCKVISILKLLFHNDDPNYDHFEQFLVRENVSEYINFTLSVDHLVKKLEELI